MQMVHLELTTAMHDGNMFYGARVTGAAPLLMHFICVEANIERVIHFSAT